MNSRNHHDSLSQSGQKNYSSGGGRSTPKYTISDAIMGKKPPQTGIFAKPKNSNRSNGKKPYGSF